MPKTLAGLCDSLAGLLPILPFILGVSLGLVPTSIVDAQQDFAKIEGVVKDQTGAVIPGATVMIRSDVLNIERRTTTSADGLYSFPQLRPQCLHNDRGSGQFHQG
jgi:Carboxypeptidase regulatory-like domain